MTGSEFVEMRKRLGPPTVAGAVTFMAFNLLFVGKEVELGWFALVITVVCWGMSVLYFRQLLKFQCPSCGVHPFDDDGLGPNNEMHCPECKVAYEEFPSYSGAPEKQVIRKIDMPWL